MTLYLSVIVFHTGPEPVHLRAPDLVCEPLVLFLPAPILTLLSEAPKNKSFLGLMGKEDKLASVLMGGLGREVPISAFLFWL